MRKTILILAAFGVMGIAQVNANGPKAKVTKELNVAPILKLNSFCNAIIKGDLETVKKMIALGEDVNQKSLGMAPVHFAARYNKTDILQVLIAHGADLKRRCDKGYSAIEHAELSGAQEAMAIIKNAMK
ncbi:MAG: ankyrin repeat domain-containing protein [Allomuricauda sp.]|nr:MAG: ankyrin repeat domain-containing protein [Allomuricauda sp.]